MNKLDNQLNKKYWENKYITGHQENYPWDKVVSFVLNNAPRQLPRQKINIIEIGFGTGSNLWFAAREGFNVAGIEQSNHAVAIAKKRFEKDLLNGDLRVGDFTQLPFGDNYADLMIDRCSLCCVGFDEAKKSITEIYRCLKDGGKFFSNGYGDQHSSAKSGKKLENGLRVNICDGSLVDAGAIRFLSRDDIETLFPNDMWKIHTIDKYQKTNILDAKSNLHEEFVITAIARKD